MGNRQALTDRDRLNPRARCAILRRREHEYSDRHRRAWLHDHDEQEDREGGEVRDHHP